MNAQGNLVTDRWFDRRFCRFTAYRDFLREFLEARHQGSAFPLPICEVRGFVQTDLGLALMYERISEPDGQLSPCLADLIKNHQLTQQHIDDLNTHFDLLITEHVIISNKNPNNIVYQSSADTSGRWVWIDSFGNKQPIPFRRMSWRLNARKLEQIRRKFIKIAEAALRSDTSAKA